MFIQKNAQLLIVERFAVSSLSPDREMLLHVPSCNTLATNRPAKIATTVSVSSSTISRQPALSGIYVV